MLTYALIFKSFLVMLYIISIGLMVISLIVGGVNHRLWMVLSTILPTLIFAIKLILGLALMMALWLGLMKIVEGLGWMTQLTRWIKPLLKRLFKDIPSDSPALDYISLNMTANMLGMGNAATPFGLRAMKELQHINPNPHCASDSMCLFLAINTSSVQLLPITTITMLAVGGATHPWSIVIPTLLATSVSTAVGIGLAKTFKHWSIFKVPL
jgi:spore maturation protein A